MRTQKETDLQDKVERLEAIIRDMAGVHAAADKAIERLTEFLERGGIDSSAVLAGEDTGEWLDENERLTAESKADKIRLADMEATCEFLHETEADNERLSAELFAAELRAKTYEEGYNESQEAIRYHQARVRALEARLREEIMESYNGLTSTRQARYSGPEEYADAVLLAEQGESDET